VEASAILRRERGRSRARFREKKEKGEKEEKGEIKKEEEGGFGSYTTWTTHQANSLRFTMLDECSRHLFVQLSGLGFRA